MNNHGTPKETKIVFFATLCAVVAFACSTISAWKIYGSKMEGLFTIISKASIFDLLLDFFLIGVFCPIFPFILLAIFTALFTVRKPLLLLIPNILWMVSLAVETSLILPAFSTGFKSYYIALWNRYPFVLCSQLTLTVIVLISLIMVSTYLLTKQRNLKPVIFFMGLHVIILIAMEIYNQVTGFSRLPLNFIMYLFASTSLVSSLVVINKKREEAVSHQG